MKANKYFSACVCVCVCVCVFLCQWVLVKLGTHHTTISLMSLATPSPARTFRPPRPLSAIFEKGEYYHGNDGSFIAMDGEEDGSGSGGEADGLCLRCSDLDLGEEGLECDTPGVLLTTLPLASGYWRASNESTTIRACLSEEACEGGSVIQRSDNYCAVGYQGPCE